MVCIEQRAGQESFDGKTIAQKRVDDPSGTNSRIELYSLSEEKEAFIRLTFGLQMADAILTHPDFQKFSSLYFPILQSTVRDVLETHEDIVAHNQRLVWSIAGELNLPSSTPDMIQNGYIGLLKAIKYFNPTLGYRFSTYARDIIWGEMLSLSSKEDAQFIFSEGQIEDRQALRSYREMFIQIKGSNPSDEETVRDLGWNSDRLQNANEACVANNMTDSLDALRFKQDNNDTTRGELTVHPDFKTIHSTEDVLFGRPDDDQMDRIFTILHDIRRATDHGTRDVNMFMEHIYDERMTVEKLARAYGLPRMEAYRILLNIEKELFEQLGIERNTSDGQARRLIRGNPDILAKRADVQVSEEELEKVRSILNVRKPDIMIEIYRKYLLTGNGSLRQIGTEHGYSKQRVHQIIKQIEKVRESLRSEIHI